MISSVKARKTIPLFWLTVIVATVVLWNAFSGPIMTALHNFGDSVFGESVSASAEEDCLEFHFIDVGQAKSILVRSPDGKFLLVDAGSNNSEPDLLKYLEEQKIDAFDCIIFTHPHEDHIGGADAVLREYDAKTILMPEVITETSSFEKLLTQLEDEKKNGASLIIPKVGDVFSFGDCEFKVLSPDNPSDDNLNNASIVVRVTWKGYSALLTGDAEKEIETKLLSDGVELKSNLLDCAHHGSNTSSTKNFLKAVSPDVAVISCGIDNPYGHPSTALLDRLDSLSVPYLRTDLNGTVLVTFSDSGMSCYSER